MIDEREKREVYAETLSLESGNGKWLMANG
jgi:hypothetical protein